MRGRCLVRGVSWIWCCGIRCMIDGYVKNGEVGVARECFDVMLERDVWSWNSMIAGYVGVGDMEAVQELFEGMVVSDVVSWNSMVDRYARIVNISVAREIFDQMRSRNVVSWKTMLALYARNKDNAECLRLFARMMQEGEVKPNEATLVSVLTAYANMGKIDRGKWKHSYVEENEKIKVDVILSISLVTMYAKCGAMDLAREVFVEMRERSVVLWNSMIMGYGAHGYGVKALEMFLEMEKSGETPNSATFVCVFICLYPCRNGVGGLVVL
ncbi:hypothetical protein IFM89_009070 [Coptis chinensis]|uniref:Pentatricopeptide repeat-containing protein n=1 Tax=Coptis chinensis TaxID=261450 RepID=A0A835INC4_9MAGN|nr:hypothetical protein IFM89_009070 [Coptis chinensis]